MYFIIFDIKRNTYLDNGKNSENPDQLKEQILSLTFPKSTQTDLNKNFVECKKLSVFKLAEKLNLEIETSREKF